MKTSTPTYKHHRFPPETIGHAVWLYCRFSLSYRDVEELLFKRGIMVTYEAIRKWYCTIRPVLRQSAATSSAPARVVS